MIGNIHPIFGLFPLILYIILAFKEVNSLVNVFICVIIGAIMVQQPLLGLGSVISKGLGSTLSLIGLIIMLGSGLGMVLTRTGASKNLVHGIMNKVGVNNEKKAILATMLCSALLTALLGTLHGANAVLAPIAVPLVAAVGLTPSTLASIFKGAGHIGLFTGPFAPPVITLMEITGLTYAQFMLHAGLPIGLIFWVVSYFMAIRIQRTTKGVYSYDDDVIDSSDATYVATAGAKRATTAFLLTLAALIGYGMVVKGGTSYAVVVMITTAITTGLAGGLKLSEIFKAITDGSARMVSMFIMFILLQPFLGFVDQSGAFAAVADLLAPVVSTGSKALFTFVTSMIGVFGISGAAVAQSVLMDKMFGELAKSLSIPTGLWAAILLVGSQMTSFAYPGSSMLGQMGLARSKDIKTMVQQGLVLVAATIVYVVVYAIVA